MSLAINDLQFARWRVLQAEMRTRELCKRLSRDDSSAGGQQALSDYWDGVVEDMRELRVRFAEHASVIDDLDWRQRQGQRDLSPSYFRARCQVGSAPEQTRAAMANEAIELRMRRSA